MPARGIALPKGRGLLFLSTGQQRLVSTLWTYVQHTTGCLRACTLRAARARRAGRARKDDLDAFWIAQGRPTSTLLPLRTGGTLRLPIDLEVGSIEAVVRFGLPTVVRQDGTQQFDAIVPAFC
jgi:hypothetical protein